MHLLRACATALCLALPPVASSAQSYTLYMVEQPGCLYCRQWDREVSAAYAASPHAEIAPLVRIALRDGPPDGVAFVSRPVLTPTFVLTRDDIEIGRIEGYQSADFFWGFLDRMLTEAGALPIPGPAADAGSD
ncbi:MAG: thioredoxin family protein [Gemmobacter sp.]